MKPTTVVQVSALAAQLPEPINCGPAVRRPVGSRSCRGCSRLGDYEVDRGDDNRLW
jgi:hypothetical protein